MEHEEHIHPEGEDMDDLQQFEHEMRANSELDEIMDNPGEIMKGMQDRDFNYYEASELMHQPESIEDLIDAKPRIDGFKGFNMLPNESHLDSNMQFNSNLNDWKVDSINFAESKPMKTISGLKVETQEEVSLLKDPIASGSLIDNF
jgi:cell fate (sporulation/competence/biofilm development) regulator YmcA (YheA/YmcA/DUF963 family)